MMDSLSNTSSDVPRLDLDAIEARIRTQHREIAYDACPVCQPALQVIAALRAVLETTSEDLCQAGCGEGLIFRRVLAYLHRKAGVA